MGYNFRALTLYCQCCDDFCSFTRSARIEAWEVVLNVNKHILEIEHHAVFLAEHYDACRFLPEFVYFIILFVTSTVFLAHSSL